jgi:hypothetical protein
MKVRNKEMRRDRVGAAIAALAICVGSAHAQLSGPANTTTGSSCSTANSGERFCGSAVSFSTPNDGTTFTSRYAWNVNGDAGTASTTTSTATHNLTFNATAVGGYRLDIVTSRIGDLNRVIDGGNTNSTAAISALTASSTPALSTGTLNLADLGDIGIGNFNTSSPYNQSTTASIFRVSNGVAQSHSLSFTWTGSITSNQSEIAIRMGLDNGTTAGCTACVYAGSPARTRDSDGQFVQVTLVPLCGNGTIDAQVSEQCDEGGANGTAGSCCNANCTFKTAGTFCRAANGVCDVDDFCTGAAGACPLTFEPNTTVCRAGSGDLCDVDELCTGSAADCPADIVSSPSTVCNSGSGDLCDTTEFCTGVPTQPCPTDTVASPGTLCRAGSGDLCDPDEVCTGVADQPCPSDTVSAGGTVCNPGSGDLCDPDQLCTGNATEPCPVDSPAGAFVVCRPGSGDLCDPDEFCTGVADQPCPADSVAGAFVQCRGVAAICDVAENCTGTATQPCPADQFVSAGTECRAVAGICDVAESCTGSAAACPADGFQPNTLSCRSPAGVCDGEEFCTGSGVACPADGKLSSVCRAAAGGCDIVETCDGAADNCPADAIEPAGAECRAITDVCDTNEVCDGSTVNCPAEVSLDDDFDGVGNGCDGCNNIGPVYVVKPFVKIKHLLTPGGDDTFKFKGEMTVPASPAIDPFTKGARVTILTSAGTGILDATIPGGPPVPQLADGWQKNVAGTFFKYRNRGLGSPTQNGVTQLKIRLDKKIPGKVKFNGRGKYETYGVPPSELPLRAIMVLDPPFALTGQCGEALFQGANPNPGTCNLNGSGSILSCK